MRSAANLYLGGGCKEIWRQAGGEVSKTEKERADGEGLAGMSGASGTWGFSLPPFCPASSHLLHTAASMRPNSTSHLSSPLH